MSKIDNSAGCRFGCSKAAAPLAALSRLRSRFCKAEFQLRHFDPARSAFLSRRISREYLGLGLRTEDFNLAIRKQSDACRAEPCYFFFDSVAPAASADFW
jgi:hypothetical protein